MTRNQEFDVAEHDGRQFLTNGEASVWLPTDMVFDKQIYRSDSMVPFIQGKSASGTVQSFWCYDFYVEETKKDKPAAPLPPGVTQPQAKGVPPEPQKTAGPPAPPLPGMKTKGASD